jgi:hypothetical protein
MFVFDDTYDQCTSANYGAGLNWKAIVLACATPYDLQAATLLSTTPTPAQQHTGANSEFYLGYRGGVFPSQATSPNSRKANTDNYYSVTHAEADLAAFRHNFGFDISGDDGHAIYYNYGDLGLGRDMHCRAFPNGQGKTGVACYVTNYGHDNAGNIAFGQDPDASINQAIANQKRIATVAMVYDPDNTLNPVRFIVFGGDDKRTQFAALDNGGLQALAHPDVASTANIAVPDNCLTCHGIASDYKPQSSGSVSVKGARFLAFDPFNLRFSTQNANFADTKVLPSIRALNALLMKTNLSTAQTEFINGMYAPKQVSDPAATANTDFVPNGWAQAQDSPASATRIYNEVVKPYCRTCHMSQQDGDPHASSGYDWASYDKFALSSTIIGIKVCSNKDHAAPMPQSERTQTLLWQSPARAHVLNGLRLAGACSP